MTSLWPGVVLYNTALNSWFYFAVLLCLGGMLLKWGKKGFSSFVFGFFVCYDEKLYMFQCVFVTVANTIDQNTKIGQYYVNYDVFYSRLFLSTLGLPTWYMASHVTGETNYLISFVLKHLTFWIKEVSTMNLSHFTCV